MEAKFSMVSQALGIVHNMRMCKHGNHSYCVTCEDKAQTVKCENTLETQNWGDDSDSDMSPLKVFSEDQNKNTSEFSEEQNKNASEFSEEQNKNAMQFLAAVKNEQPGDAQTTMDYSQSSEEDSDNDACVLVAKLMIMTYCAMKS